MEHRDGGGEPGLEIRVMDSRGETAGAAGRVNLLLDCLD